MYDLINNQAAIAQTKFNTSESEIVTFASLSAKVPHATLAPHSGNGTGADDAVTATATAIASYSAASGFADSYASSTTAASESTSDSSNPTKESVSLVGPAVGGAAAGVLVLGSAVFVWKTMAAKKKEKRHAQGQGIAQEASLDEAKVPLVPEDGEYDRLNQIQTAYRDGGVHHA